MSTLHCLVLLIFIALSDSVNLDIPCVNNTQCGEPSAICQGGICRCNSPYYTPCGTSECKVKDKFVYQGGECRVNENCLNNADCTENRCQCRTDYTAMNGLCYKSLNANCTNPSECWPNECRNKICQCPLGFISKNDHNRCERKSANIYENWANANASNDFCYPTDPYNCRVSSALCQNDSQHSENFCQCPSTHTADYVKQECQLKVYSGLSPSNTALPFDECGKCQVDNALCAFVGNQTTCWCQAGFIKNGNKCLKHRRLFIFPNRNDINLHNYTSNCSKSENNNFCTCAPGDQFIDRTSTCQPIKPDEYSLCTHIDSKGKPIRNDGLCPAPLKCEAQQDKYVCSCGSDKYFDEKSNACYYFLERNLTDANATHCPENSILIDSKCQCKSVGIFSLSTDNKRCELKLNETGDSQEKPTCNTSNTLGDEFCADDFGGNAKFCRTGQCRCMLNSSYYANNKCVTLIYAHPGIKVICPDNAENTNGSCQCKTGYRVEIETNRTCVRKVEQLDKSIENILWNLTIDDCKALFPSQPVNVTNNTCTCDDNAFSNGTTCIFYLGFPSPPSNHSMIQCPKNANANSGSCQCNSGYKEMTNTTCDPLTTTVYQHNERIGENLTNITSDDCIALFGSAADVSENGTFCRCRNETVAFWNKNKCYFRVETNLGDIDPDSACPPYSKKTNNRCKCLFGYQTNPSRTACELFSQYIFPGIHEYYLYTCDVHDDCGDNAEKHGIECEFINENYRVCQCKKDYLFNPIDSTCVEKQCHPKCSDNEKCQNDRCICKIGYCREWQLHDQCNQTYWYTENEAIECSFDCERVQCSSGYHNNGSNCVKYRFDNRCVHDPYLCSNITTGSQCDEMENKCTCSPDYYQTEGSRICARAVGLSCINPIDCGDFGDCVNRTCVCRSGRKEEERTDSFGRKIKVCINGIDQIRFNFVLFFFIIIIRVLVV